MVARLAYRFVKRVTSAVVIGRRNAFCPNAVTNCWMQAALSVVHGSTFAFAVVLAITCVASESAAVLKPSQARWSTEPTVSGASMLDGCTSIPSRSRVVLSYSARVSRGSCDVVGTPGVQTVGSTGVPVPPAPVPVVLPVPVPTVLPVPVPTVLPVPEPVLAPAPVPFPVVDCDPPMAPWHPARSATPTINVLQVFMRSPRPGMFREKLTRKRTRSAHVDANAYDPAVANSGDPAHRSAESVKVL